MEDQVTAMIAHMAKSHQEMAKIIESKKHVTVRMSQNIQMMPDQEVGFEGMDGVIDHAGEVTKNIVSYLNSLADFEESIAETLESVIPELKDTEEE